MPKQKDYTKQTFLLAALVILLLLAIGLIPPFRAGKTLVKRANILSDLIETADRPIAPVTDKDILDTSFVAEMPVGLQDTVPASDTKPVRQAAAVGSATPAAEKSVRVAAAEDRPKARPYATLAETQGTGEEPDDGNIYIEDFSPNRDMTDRFYRALAYETPRRPVRIAVLGDSFIEGDIITADMREQLQLLYGGCGVGFVPFSSPLSKYRGTIKHTFDRWRDYNILKKKTVPEQFKDKFFVSGQLSVPDEGASVTYRGVNFRRRIEKFSSGRLLFMNPRETEIRVRINDSTEYLFKPAASAQIEEASVQGDIRRLDIALSKTDGFIGYGVIMEDTVGVSVHNFSVRGNSGLALFGTNGGINAQIDSLMRYDMVILQYGLNAMSADVTDYSYYGKQLRRIIAFIKSCFPRSAVVVMSVGDRSTLKDGSAVTMPAVKAMIREQRRAAAAEGVAFWNTFEAMGGDNSMAEFVKRKWAAKDYTHIGYNGGKHIAGQFVKALSSSVSRIVETDRKVREAVRLDQSTLTAADSLFRTSVAPSVASIPGSRLYE